jgi:hypothetical protein
MKAYNTINTWQSSKNNTIRLTLIKIIDLQTNALLVRSYNHYLNANPATLIHTDMVDGEAKPRQ